MRTKTLVLTALGSLSAMGLMAQTNVYSLNAVGYINVTCNPGFTIISDQLWNSPGSPNLLGQVLRVPSDTSQDGDLLYKWTGTGFVVYQADSTKANGWDPAPNGSDPGTNVTLNPGEAAFFDNDQGGGPVTFTFVGTVPQGTNTVNITTGFNLISSIVPQSGHLTADLGFPVDRVNGSQDGDLAYFFSNTSGYSLYQVDSSQASGWDPPGGDPVANVGTGFFYSAQGPATWTRIFSVNQ